MIINSSSISKSRASIINLVFNYLSAFIQIFNSVLLLPLYLSFFTLSDYGAWVASAAILNVFLIVDPGLATITTTRLSQAFSSDDDDNFQSIFLSGILLAVAMGVLTFIIGWLLIGLIPSMISYDGDRNDEIYLAMLLHVTAMSLSPLASVFGSFFQSLLKTFVGSFIWICSIIASPITIIICLYGDWGIASLPMGYLATNVFAVIVKSIAVIGYYWKKSIQVSLFKIKNINIKLLFHDIKYFYLKRFSSSLAENLETSMAGIFFSTEVSGSVSIIKKLIMSISLFSNSISSSIFSSMSHSFAENNPDSLKSALIKTIYASDLIQIFGLCILFLAYKPLLFVWLGQDIDLSYLFIIAISISSFVMIKSNLLYTILISKGLFKETSLIYILEIIIRLVGSFILVKVVGLYALPLAAFLGTSSTLFILSKILIIKSSITRSEILLPFSRYKYCVTALAVFYGYFITYPNSQLDAITTIIYSSASFLFLMLLSKSLRTFVLETYNNYKKK